MTQAKELSGTQVHYCTVPQQGTAATDDNWSVWRPPFNCTVTAVSFIPNAAITADGTNYSTYTLTNKGSGSGSTSIATRAWSATNSVASTPDAMTLSGTAANLDLTADDNIEIVKTHAGTGLVIADGSIRITYKRR